MGALARLRALPWPDRALTASAALLLASFTVAVRLIPFRRLVGWTGRVRRSGAAEPESIDRVTRAIRLAAPRLPGANCLPQALTARWLLGWYGHQSQIRLGVAKNAEGRIEAHAWVESGGAVVIGGFSALGRYAPLPTLDEPGAG